MTVQEMEWGGNYKVGIRSFLKDTYYFYQKKLE